MRTITAAIVSLVLAASSVQAQQRSARVASVIEDLVAANRILAAQGILPGYGHVSARHPDDPTRYFLSRSLAPELVTADDDERRGQEGPQREGPSQHCVPSVCGGKNIGIAPASWRASMKTNVSPVWSPVKHTGPLATRHHVLHR